MRVRLLLLSALFMLTTAVLTGCWNYQEIDKLSIVAGMAVDRYGPGGFRITVEIVDMSQSGKEAKIKSKIVESYGNTIFDAVRNAVEITPGKLYWGQMQTAIISREIAEGGIIKVLNWLDQDAELRSNINLLISQGDSARVIFQAESSGPEIRSFSIYDMLKAQKSLSKAPNIQLYQLIETIGEDGISAVLPAIDLVEVDQKKTMRVSGTAIFKKDRLVGFLNDDDTKYFLFAVDKIKKGLLVEQDIPKGQHMEIVLEVLSNHTEIKPVYQAGNLQMNMNIKTQTAIGEHGPEENMLELSKIQELKSAAEESLIRKVESIIRKVQKEFDVDIFGFGRSVKAEMPEVWRQLAPEWNRVFKNLNVEIQTDIKIRNSALLSKAIKAGD